MLTRFWRSARLFLDSRRQSRVPFHSAERLQRIGAERLRRIVRHAYASVPFYRRVMDQRGFHPDDFRSVSDLKRLPLIDKRTVQENPEQFQSTTVDPAACLILKSGSGTVTRWSADAALRGLAIAERERAVWKPLAGARAGCRQLQILAPGSSSLSVRAFWNERVVTPGWISRKYYADPFLPYEEIVDKMNLIRPHVAFSYGSYIEHFFKYLLDSGRQPHLPRVWYYGADTLFREWRDLVEEKFGVKIYSNYAATETGRLGFECENRRGYHLNIDFVAVRLVDGGGNDVEDGQQGEVTVSCLSNFATVLLNYRLGDVGEMQPGGCSCGRRLPLLRELHGRVSQTIVLADGRAITSGAFLMQFSNELQSVLKAQAVSLGPGRLCWKVVPGRGIERSAFRARLLERCRTVFGASVEADVEFVDDIAPAASGKFETLTRGGPETGTTDGIG